MKKQPRMTDDQMYEILEQFANQHTLARDIEVKMSSFSTHFSPRFPAVSFKHEDSDLLGEILRGAMHLMMWARRNNVVRLKKIQRRSKKEYF